MRLFQHSYFRVFFTLAFVQSTILLLASSAAKVHGNPEHFDKESLLASLTHLQSKAPKIRAEVILDRHVITARGPGSYVDEYTLEVEVYDSEMAERFRTEYTYYDEFSKAIELDGEVLSAGAKKPVQVKSKSVQDIAAYDGFSLASSGRLKVMQLPLPTAYPATIKIHTVRDVKESVAFPSVSWFYGPNVFITKGELILQGDLSQILWQVIDSGNFIAQKKDASEVRFSVSELSPTVMEDFAPSALKRGPAVLLAPKEGKLEGSSGDFRTWNGLGAWTASLLAERNDLPAEASDEVRALVEGIDDPLERVRKVYTYMQARTHYVSIQLGIGGFKPMKPADVHANGYGDCKALSNYTRLLLEAVDIESYYCVIGVGDREILYPEFASVNQANHAMLAVPMQQDTLWLECTSQLTPADFIGQSSSGRYALLVKNGTGELVRTHGASANENQITSVATIQLDKEGRGAFTRKTQSTRSQAELAFRLSLENAQERKVIGRKFYKKSINDYEISSTIRQTPQGPVGTIIESGTFPILAKKLGNKLVLPNFGYQATPDGPQDSLDRGQPIEISDSYLRSDTVRYLLPKGYQFLSSLPEAEVASPHAFYSLSAKPIPSGLEVVRTVEVRGGIYPASAAKQIAAFYREVSRADRGILGIEPIGKSGT